MLNKVQIIGRLGSDPESKTTSSGKTVARLSVATSEKWKDKSGDQQEKTEWHRVVVWGAQAVHCGRLLSKGRLVYIEGRLETRSWEDNSGVKRYSTEIVADNVVFLDKSESNSEPDFNSTSEIPF